MTDIKYIKDTIEQAFQAAKDATEKMITENPETWYPCGFAWVRIKPARGTFVKALKEMKRGHTDEYEGGFVVYNPSGNHTQWMDAKFAGACAFADVLKSAGVKCYAQARMD